MKIACLIFMMIGSATLAPRIAYAVEPDQGAQQAASDGAAKTGRSHDTEHGTRAEGHPKDGNPSDGERFHRRVPDKKHWPSRVSVTKTTPREPSPNSRERSMSTNAANFHQPGPNRSGAVAKGVPIQNETVNDALPVRPSGVVRGTASSLNNVRHRAPNPAVIGGAANSQGKNTGAINGTRMNRKP